MEQLMVTPHAPHRADARKNAAVRLIGLVDLVLVTAGAAADLPRSLPRQFSGAVLQRHAVSADQLARACTFPPSRAPSSRPTWRLLLLQPGFHAERI